MVENWGTGKPDYSERVFKTAAPIIETEESFQTRLYFHSSGTISATSIATITPTTLVDANNIWQIFEIHASIDSTTLIQVRFIDSTPAYAFYGSLGYGKIEMKLKEGYPIEEGSTCQFEITNWDNNAHNYRITFHGLAIKTGI